MEKQFAYSKHQFDSSQKHACCLVLLIFLKAWVIALFWHWSYLTNFGDIWNIFHIWPLCVTFQQLWLLNFKDGPRNFATSKISVLRQERTSFSFLFTTIAKRPFLLCQGSWIHLCTVTSLYSSMSRVADCYRNICDGFYFVKIVGLQATAYFKWNLTQTLCWKSARNFKQLQLNYINNHQKRKKST